MIDHIIAITIYLNWWGYVCMFIIYTHKRFSLFHKILCKIWIIIYLDTEKNEWPNFNTKELIPGCPNRSMGGSKHSQYHSSAICQCEKVYINRIYTNKKYQYCFAKGWSRFQTSNTSDMRDLGNNVFDELKENLPSAITKARSRKRLQTDHTDPRRGGGHVL